MFADFKAKVVAWFHDSETILIARLTMLVGALLQVVTMIDPMLLSPVLPPHWFPVFLIAHGVLLEYLRRRRATDLGN
ncbi:MAG: hypothetical protein EOR00_09195 [Mesorhizobium sp.]|uniref:hypothetical protein n=1 Tax=Mesorhizobium sp. TaxID=1871066 RepID=UPI000FE844EF|nr:hypothetical protein [Mesorhizobium sp.]RWP19272.1 MAG: hypothetical protein EOR00_09195 [Mesorhizobium sp.]